MILKVFLQRRPGSGKGKKKRFRVWNRPSASSSPINQPAMPRFIVVALKEAFRRAPGKITCLGGGPEGAAVLVRIPCYRESGEIAQSRVFDRLIMTFFQPVGGRRPALNALVTADQRRPERLMRHIEVPTPAWRRPALSGGSELCSACAIYNIDKQRPRERRPEKSAAGSSAPRVNSAKEIRHHRLKASCACSGRRAPCWREISRGYQTSPSEVIDFR